MPPMYNPQDAKRAIIMAQISRMPGGRELLAAMEAMRARREQANQQREQQQAQETAQRNGLIGAVAAPVGTIGGMAAYNYFTRTPTPGGGNPQTQAPATPVLRDVSYTGGGNGMLGSGAPSTAPQASPGAMGAESAGSVPVDGQVSTMPQGEAGGSSWMDSANVGRGVQGALGAYQLYNAYGDYKDGNYTGAAVNGMAGATGVGAAAGSTYAAAAAPYAGIAAGAYGAYQNNKAIGSMPAGSDRDRAGAKGGAVAGAAIGAGVGSIVPGFGTAIGAGIGALIGGAAGFVDSKLGSSKDKYQMIRDQGREWLQSNGILDDKYQGTLADGSKFDFGKDGDKAGKLDTKNPDWGQAAAFGNVLASIEGLYGRGREAMATLYSNAATSNAKDVNGIVANYQHFAKQRGITYDAAKQQLDKMLQEGRISQQEHGIFVADAAKFIPGASNVPSAQQPQQPARSNTLSPGIGLNGQPIQNKPYFPSNPDRNWTKDPSKWGL